MGGRSGGGDSGAGGAKRVGGLMLNAPARQLLSNEVHMEVGLCVHACVCVHMYACACLCVSHVIRACCL